MCEPEIRVLSDPTRPDWTRGDGPRPIRSYVWRPARATNPPVVLLSHGTGGSAVDQAWLADALVGAGFAVIGVDHHGNNSVDDYLPEGFAFDWERARDLSYALSHIHGVDRTRAGASGFSIGGYTVLALAGARIDGAVYRAVRTGAVELPPLPEFPNLVHEMRSRYSDADLEALLPQATASYADERIRAAFAIAPAIGQLVDAASLEAIDKPVAIRYGEADDNCVPELNALRYGAHIPDADLRSVGTGIGHYVFAGEAEPDPYGVREKVAADAVNFFTAQLEGRLASFA